MVFVFGLQTLYLKAFSIFYYSEGLKPKNKGHTNFYECCDLTKKVYLIYTVEFDVTILYYPSTLLLVHQEIVNSTSISLIFFKANLMDALPGRGESPTQLWLFICFSTSSLIKKIYMLVSYYLVIMTIKIIPRYLIK